jgi:hypothetical protein
MTSDRGTTSARTRGLDGRKDQFRIEAQHLLDVGRVRVERLDQRFARQDEGLVIGIEVMHDPFAQPTFRIPQANDRSGSNFSSRDAAGIGYGVSLSHERSSSSARAGRVELDGDMASPHERAQELCKLLSQLDDIVALGFEQLEKRTQMRGRQRWASAVKRSLAVHQIVHATADVLRVSLV